jgi:hypothetical protein
MDNGEDTAPKKRRTTYNREHPTDNPKPPKRSRAEIQAAAAEKKALVVAKKNQRAAGEVKKQEERRASLKEVAAVEDAIQRIHRQYQLQAERPDLQTMETYQTVQDAQAALELTNSGRIGDESDVYDPPSPRMTPQAQPNFDTGLDGRPLEKAFDLEELEHDDDDDMYMPDKAIESESQDESISSEAHMEQGKSLKKREKMPKVSIQTIISEFTGATHQWLRPLRGHCVRIFKLIALSWHRDMPQ